MPYTPARGHRAGGGVWLACLFPVDAWWLIAGEGAPGRQVVGCGWRASARWYMCKVLRLQNGVMHEAWSRKKLCYYSLRTMAAALVLLRRHTQTRNWRRYGDWSIHEQDPDRDPLPTQACPHGTLTLAGPVHISRTGVCVPDYITLCCILWTGSTRGSAKHVLGVSAASTTH